MNTADIHVAVIGAGPAGLAAIKTMKEEGFRVTGFERRPEVGGLWAYSENPQYTSATRSTKAQLSKFLMPFTDFPIPDDFPLHLDTEHFAKYYQSYAEHFDLLRNIVFNSTVASLSKTEDGTKWALSLVGEESPRVFDKVILASGSEITASIPNIEGLDLFEGEFIHSQAYKGPEPYVGKNVIVLGAGNTAADTAVDLGPRAAKVYWSHRRGAIVMPRMVKGQRFDSFASWKKTRMGFWAAKAMPSIHRWMFDKFFSSIMKTTWGTLDASWGLETSPHYATNIGSLLFNDDIIPSLREGKVISKVGVRKVVGPRAVELQDGTVLEDVDAIIACTGYHNTLQVLDGVVSYSPAHPKTRPIPDLYQGLFPLGHADSLACLNYVVIMDTASTVRELCALAIAQVWTGKSQLPSRAEMEAHVLESQAWFAKQALESPVPIYEGTREPHEWLKFVNETAGTGVYENLSWTWEGVRFFLREPKLCSMMMWGVNTPHLYRYFETGKRKAWDGAREAIVHANHLSDIDLGYVKPKTN